MLLTNKLKNTIKFEEKLATVIKPAADEIIVCNRERCKKEGRDKKFATKSRKAVHDIFAHLTISICDKCETAVPSACWYRHWISNCDFKKTYEAIQDLYDKMYIKL